MSDQPTSKPSDINLPSIDDVKETINKVGESVNKTLNDPQVQPHVEKGKTFYEANKTPILIAGVFVAWRLNNKRVSAKTTKKVLKTLAKAGKTGATQPFQNQAQQALPSMFDILDDLRATPEMALIPHGEGMVHLLGPTKDVIVTVFGDFTRMDTQQIFDYAGRALGIRGYK